MPQGIPNGARWLRGEHPNATRNQRTANIDDCQCCACPLRVTDENSIFAWTKSGFGLICLLPGLGLIVRCRET
jgi:hypothetical protein